MIQSRHARSLSFISALIGTSALIASTHSCKSDRDPVYPPAPPIDYTRDAAPADAVSPSWASDASGGSSDAAPPPAPLDPATLGRLETRISDRARHAGAGKQEGGAFGGLLREGQALEQSLNLEPTRCYSVFASGDTGVAEVDIQVIAKAPLPLPQPGPTLVVDNTTGPDAAVTPCWKSLVPVLVPALVIVKARQGQGPVAAAVYSK
jgi:hypothetical protein